MAALDRRALACAGTALAAVALLAGADGGYGSTAWGAFGAAAGWAALLGILLARGGPRGRAEQLFVGLLAAFAGWTLLSALWSKSAPSSIVEAQRLLVAVGGPLAALTLCRARDAVALRLGVLAGVTLVCAANLLHRLRGYEQMTGAESEPVGYANGLGILAALGLLLALGLVRRWPLPVVAAAAVCSVTLVLSESTGAQLALVAGLAVAGIAAGGRLRVAGAVVLAAGIAFAAVSFDGPREQYWRVAADGVAERPLLGSGAGTFRQLWLEEREVERNVRDAHSLYLETLTELGPLGLALLLAALAVPFVGARQSPLAAGAYAAVVLHAAADWTWELTGIALAALLVGVSLLLGERPPGRVAWRPAWTVLAAAVALAAAVTLAGGLALDGAQRALRGGDAALAESRADQARTLAPWSTEASLTHAEALLALGDRDGAAEVLREAVAADPREYSLWALLVQASEGAERERALERARSLNPLGGA